MHGASSFVVASRVGADRVWPSPRPLVAPATRRGGIDYDAGRP